MNQDRIPLSKEQLRCWVKQIAEQHTKGAIIVDPSSDTFPIIYCNDAFIKMTGYTNEEIVGQTLHFMNGKKTNETMVCRLQETLQRKEPFQQKLIQYKQDGTAFWHEMTCHPMKDTNNDVQFLLIYCENTTASALNRMISKLEIEVYEHLENDLDDSIIFQFITEKMETHYLRNAYCVIQLMQVDGTLKVIGHGSLPFRIAQQLTDEDREKYSEINSEDIIESVFTSKKSRCKHFLSSDEEFVITGSWSKPIISKTKNIKGYITLYFNEFEKLDQTDIHFLNRIAPLITLAQKYGDQKRELRKLAYFDTAIDIPNAHYFRMKLDEWIKEGKEGVVILIQPSEYSNIVDLYGRSIGDELLKQIVERLNLHRKNHIEFIARFSDSLIIASCIDHEKLQHYDSRVRPLTIIPYFLSEKETYITLKIGVGYFNGQSTSDDSIRQADIALSKARQQSGTSIAYFEREIDEKLKLEMDTLNQLTHGLNNDEFTIHLQPKMNMKTGKIDGFEALSRWNSSTLGNVPPSIFIPLAEQSGHIKEIDISVMRKALTWLNARINKGLKVAPIAVNISPDHFYDESFLEHFKEIIKEYNVPLHLLKLELTESIELVDFTKAKETLTELKMLGIDSSIDDFGVGFSSLSYLPKLPFTEIKIDRSFISALNDPGMYAVIQTIIQLASNLQMKAVAEGIETLEQYIMLKNMGCHIGQGYFLHKPMPLEVASAMLDSL